MLKLENFTLLMIVLPTKPTILNQMVPFLKRKNDFKKFTKHNLHKFNIVHVNFQEVKFFFPQFYKFEGVFRLN